MYQKYGTWNSEFDTFRLGHVDQDNVSAYISRTLPGDVSCLLFCDRSGILPCQNPVQPIRQKEPPASSVGHRHTVLHENQFISISVCLECGRGAAHWSSTYRTSHDDNSVAGAVYHRQHGPSYQAGAESESLQWGALPRPRGSKSTDLHWRWGNDERHAQRMCERRIATYSLRRLFSSGAFMEDFGLYGSDPRSKVDPALDSHR